MAAAREAHRDAYGLAGCLAAVAELFASAGALSVAAVEKALYQLDMVTLMAGGRYRSTANQLIDSLQPLLPPTSTSTPAHTARPLDNACATASGSALGGVKRVFTAMTSEDVGGKAVEADARNAEAMPSVEVPRRQIPQLRKDFATPDYCSLLCEDEEEDPEAGSDVVANAWLGPKGTCSPCHTDPTHNLLCQVVGSKEVTLFAPQHSAGLYPNEGIMSNTSRVDVGAGAVDSEGEALYIPPLWWHYIRSLETSFSCDAAIGAIRGYDVFQLSITTRAAETAEVGHLLEQLIEPMREQIVSRALCSEPGDVALCQDPSYFLSFGILADRGLDVVPVSTDEDSGLTAHKLEEAFEAVAAKGKKAVMVYFVPTHCNPTGFTIGAEEREKLVRVAEKWRVTLVADEVYHLLHYFPEEPLPPVMACVSGGSQRVVSISSFSKVLCPGIRVGWIHSANVDLVSRIRGSGVFVSGGVSCQFTSRMVAHAMQTGALEEHLAQNCTQLGAKARALSSALSKYLPPGCTFAPPRGGYFLWLGLPWPGGALLGQGLRGTHGQGIGVSAGGYHNVLVPRGLAALNSAGIDMYAPEHNNVAVKIAGSVTHDKDKEPRTWKGFVQGYISIDRGDLAQLLLDKAAALPNVRVHYLHSLEGVDVAANVATFNLVGKEGTQVLQEFDLLVGADGVRSGVRAAMQDQVPGFSVKIVEENSEYKTLNLGHARTLRGYEPSLDWEHSTIAGALVQPRSGPHSFESAGTTVESVGTFLAETFPQLREGRTDEEWRGIAEQLLSKRPAFNRTVYCSALAHARVVLGVNSALETVVMLAEELGCTGTAETVKTEDVPAALQRFNARRLPDAHAVCRISQNSTGKTALARTVFGMQIACTLLLGKLGLAAPPAMMQVAKPHLTYSALAAQMRRQARFANAFLLATVSSIAAAVTLRSLQPPLALCGALMGMAVLRRSAAAVAGSKRKSAAAA
ncbi:hypothetical protein JKP88DRAFT_353273 [Tribonema minus]|uniref:JmjC domain-containing protein n=1 Tax=Tribonema minus TaxID=303371 RepID=A0A836CJX1_9STRA|nr:hypothetical protein JKP88DRAFT_353273 [Tribonema minus]